MNIFWVYKLLFSFLSIGLFLFSLRKLYPKLKNFYNEYSELPNNLKNYFKRRVIKGLIKGIKHNKLLFILNILLLIVLITINILVWLVRFT